PPATSEMYTLSLHDALPISAANSRRPLCFRRPGEIRCSLAPSELGSPAAVAQGGRSPILRVERAMPQRPFRVPARNARWDMARSDRKSTRLNSSHDQISYAV